MPDTFASQHAHAPARLPQESKALRGSDPCDICHHEVILLRQASACLQHSRLLHFCLFFVSLKDVLASQSLHGGKYVSKHTGTVETARQHLHLSPAPGRHSRFFTLSFFFHALRKKKSLICHCTLHFGGGSAAAHVERCVWAKCRCCCADGPANGTAASYAGNGAENGRACVTDDDDDGNDDDVDPRTLQQAVDQLAKFTSENAEDPGAPVRVWGMLLCCESASYKVT